MRVKEFFDTEFKQYSIYDCVRSIPNVIDGWKPSQRKCIYGILDRGENASEFKVAQLSAHIANVSSYHHGENSLNETIVKLAQDFTGSNNINYFEPVGQFGNRLSSDSASPRYIFTKLTENFRKLYKKDDDIILNYIESDGQSIEPDIYIPIIPNVLINGARGIGSGYSTNILNHNPQDLVNNILTILDGKKPLTILPWYRGFNGTITENNKQIIFTGLLEVVNTTTIKITELPIGYFLDDYKKILFKLQDDGIIKDFENHSTDSTFEFLVNVPRTTTTLNHEELIAKFKLTSKMTQNFTLWSADNHIRVFEDAQAIINYFVEFRLSKYEERRLKLMQIYNAQYDWLCEKKKFIEWYIVNSKTFSSKNKKELVELLSDNGFINIQDLLEIKLYNLTKDDITKLENNIIKIENDIAALAKTNAAKMYKKELNDLKL